MVYTHNSDSGTEFSQSPNDLLITDSVFEQNSYFTDDYRCMHNLFQFSPVRIPLVGAGGIAFYFTQTAFKYYATINHSSITENNGTITGGLFAVYINTPHTSKLTITGHTTLLNNTNLFDPPYCPGRSLASFVYFTDSFIDAHKVNANSNDWTPLVVEETLFTNHSGRQTSSLVYISLVSQSLFNVAVEFTSVNFTHNKAYFNGICMYAETTYGFMSHVKSLNLLMTDVFVDNNSQDFGRSAVITQTNSSHFLLSRLGRVDIVGLSSRGSTFVNNFGSVFDVFATDVRLSGNITFINNLATQGAAFLLRSDSHIIMVENSTILFKNNSAFLDGGAIYAYDTGTENYVCVLQVDSDKRNLSSINLNVIFDGNTANKSGPSTYASPIQQCFQTRVHVFPRYLSSLYSHIFTFKVNTTQALASPAISVCPCVNDTPDCKKEFELQTIYPGDSISVSLIAIDSVGGKVYSQATASFSEVDSTVLALPDWWLKDDQEVVTLYNNRCRNLQYNVNTLHEGGTGRINFAVPGLPPLAYLIVHAKSCPAGFSLNRTLGKCQCDHFLVTLDITCEISSKMLMSPVVSAWIGVVDLNNTMTVGFAQYCPRGFCIRGARLYMAQENSSVCDNNRTGIICGSCLPGYSITLGPSKCAKCSNYWLFTIPAYLVAGLMAVLVMFLFNITLHLGTIGGLIFYANLFPVVILVDRHTWLIPFTEPFFILNLDQSFSSCLFDGMTMTTKMVFLLAYAFYLWFLVAVMILVAQCSSRVSAIIMKSSVQVLMTLVHLSLSRLLITTIDIYSYARVFTAVSNDSVWLIDGSVPYGGTAGHIILLLIATLIGIFIIIPYLLVGTLGSFGLRYHWVNKLRPFIDAIHGPYKDKRQYWFGVRLILLVAVYINYTLLRGQYPKEQSLVTLSLMVMFVTSQAILKPFQSELIGGLDMWFMFNAIMLVIINVYKVLGAHHAEYLLLLNLITVLITMAVVVCGHVFKFGRCFKCCMRLKSVQSQNSHFTSRAHSSVMTRSYHTLSDQQQRGATNLALRAPDESLTGSDLYKLRESLLED